LFTPACCEQIVVASKMRAGVFWSHRGWLKRPGAPVELAMWPLVVGRVRVAAVK
jgi:hypothetical protein